MLEEVQEESFANGRQEGMLANMLKVFLKLIAKGFSFVDAAETAGAETPDQVEYLRQHLPAH